MLRFVLSCAVGFACCSYSAPKISKIQSCRDLKTALEAAYQNNGSILEARQNVLANHDKITQYLAGFKPTVTFNAGLQKSYNSISNTEAGNSPNSNNQSTGGEQTQRTYGVRGEYNIFEGGRTIHGFKAQDTQIRSLWADLQSKEQNVLLEVIKSYLDILYYQGVCKAYRAALDQYKRAYDSAFEKHKVGEEALTQVKNAEAEYNNALSILHQNEQQLIQSQNNFYQLTGLEAQDLQSVDFPNVQNMQNIERLFEKAKDKNPNILNVILQHKSAQYEKRTAEGSMLPRADLFVQVNRSESPSRQDGKADDPKNQNSFPGGQLFTNLFQTQTQFGINVKWTLYDGGIARSQRRLAHEKSMLSRVTLNKIFQQLRQNIRDGVSAIKIYKDNIEVQKAQIDARKVALEATIQEQNAGTKVVLDVLFAQKFLLDAERGYQEALRSYFVAYYTLLSIVGDLTPTYLKLGIREFSPLDHYEQAKKRL